MILHTSRICSILAVTALLMCGTAAAAHASEFTDLTPVPALDLLHAAGKSSPYAGSLDSASVRVAIHVVRASDGSGGLSAEVLDGMIARMCDDFMNAKIALTVVNITNLENSAFLSNPISSVGALLQVERSIDAIDVYLAPGSAQPEGLAEAIPGTGLVLADSTSAGAALCHLLGHCLGLYDTDEVAFGQDTPGAQNPSDLGDLVADTPADPGLLGFVDYLCQLDSGFETLYPGYAPDTTNIMSRARIECVESFSAEQGARMLASLENDAALQAVVETESKYLDRSSYTNIRNLAAFPTFINEPQNAAAFDINGDGLKDMLVCGFADVNPVTNRARACVCTGINSDHGVPEFVDQTSYAFAGATQPVNGVTGIILADYDNDGYIDFYAPRPSYSDTQIEPHLHQLYRAQGDGTFVDVTSQVGLVFSSANDDETISGSWGDYNGDGLVDLLTLRSLAGTNPSASPVSTQLHLYKNVRAVLGGAWAFTDVTTVAGLNVADNWIISALWVDFDQDHDLDLVLMQSSQNVGGGDGIHSRYYANNGDGTFSNVTASRLPDHAKHWDDSHGFAVAADMDNDGDVDVGYHHQNEVGWFQNDFNVGNSRGVGLGRLLYCWGRRPTSGEEWKTAPRDLEVFDYNLDGYNDMVVANDQETRSGANPRQWLYANKANGLSFDVGAITGTNGECTETLGSCAADFNSDGYTDLYLGVPRSKSFYFVSRNTGTAIGPHWLGVRLAANSNSCNTRGIGATVIAFAADYEQAQVVDGGSGRAGQHDLDLIFGLGSATHVDSLRVIWPCGQDQVVYPSAIDQYITIGLDMPIIDDATVNSAVEYNIGEAVQTWVFKWQTNFPSNDALDRIVFNSALNVPGVGVVSSLGFGDPNVSIASHALSSGSVQHRLEWRNVPCMGPIQVGYRAASRTIDFEDMSGPAPARKIVVPYCVIAP